MLQAGTQQVTSKIPSNLLMIISRCEFGNSLVFRERTNPIPSIKTFAENTREKGGGDSKEKGGVSICYTMRI